MHARHATLLVRYFQNELQCVHIFGQVNAIVYAMEDRRLFPYAQTHRERTTEEKIVDAAMEAYAQRGIDITSLRVVGDYAGVSVGAVQHHFPTKGDLIDAVNNRVLQIISDYLEPPPLDEGAAELPADGYSSEGPDDRLVSLIADHPIAMDYLGRALVEGDASNGVGKVIFDGIATISRAQGNHFEALGYLHDDIDFLWSFLNPIVMRIGAIILRKHLERYLDGSFYDEEVLERWNSAIQSLLRKGAFKSVPD